MSLRNLLFPPLQCFRPGIGRLWFMGHVMGSFVIPRGSEKVLISMAQKRKMVHFENLNDALKQSN